MTLIQPIIINLQTSIMSSSILKYGQIIRIRSNSLSNAFVTSKSYTDQNIYFQIYNNDQKLARGNDLLNINNYRESLFEVLPTSSFEINDEMNSQKTEAKKAQSAPRAKTQEEQFKAIISQKREKVISFGDKVVFRHLDSQYYIYGSFDCATSGIGAFKIQLKKELSQKIIFQLMSYRTYEKEGDEMSISAPFMIYHCETQCFMSYCLENIFLDRGKQHKRQFRTHLQAIDKDFPVYPPQTKQAFYLQNEQYRGEDIPEEGSSRVQQILPKSARFLIINQNIPKRVFKLVVHNQFEMKINKQKIRNHDIVYFIHTKDDKYMCPNNFTSEVFLKKRKNQTDLTDIFDGLWEIEEVKMIEENKNQEMSLNRKMPSSKKTIQKKDGKQKEKDVKIGGNLGNFLFPGGGGLNQTQTFLTATVNPTITDGQVRAGFANIGQGEQDEEGEKNKKKQKYLLRHLASGRIIYVFKNQIKIQLHHYIDLDQKLLLLESIDNKLMDGALVQFTFKMRQGDGASGTKGKFMKYFLDIKSEKNKINREQINQNFIREQNEDDEVQSNVISETDSMDEIQKTYASYFQTDKLALTLDSSEHGFRIYKISEEVKQLCLFVLSSQEIVSKFTKLIEEYESIEELIKQLNVFLLNNVINVIKSMIGFIYDCEYNKIAQSGNNPNSKKQRIFDELGMIELITRMLEQINMRDPPAIDTEDFVSFNYKSKKIERLKDLEKINKNSQYKKVRTVYQLGYKLLESIAANNDLMKIKISKYLQKYLSHILQKANKTVYKSIQQVLDGNYLALEKIEDSYIKQLIKSFDKNDPDPADLYFLSRLCLCKQKTVVKNQNAIYTNFYSQQDTAEENGRMVEFQEHIDSKKKYIDQEVSPNKFKFREDQKKMQILSQIIPKTPAQFRTLSQLYEECQLMKGEGGYDPEKNHWSYFMQYLNLLADICVQRNNSPLSYIEKKLSLKTLVAFLHQNTVKKNLLFQPFIRLVHHAFVENQIFEQINRITKVKQWNELGNFNIPKAKNPISNDIQKTMILIMDYIRRVNKNPFTVKKDIKEIKNTQDSILQETADAGQPASIDFNVDDKNRLINVKTFLEILKSTLNLGFWPQMEEMKKMVPYMLKILRFDIQYANKAALQKRALDTKNNENMHLDDDQHRAEVYKTIKQQLKLNKPNIVLLVQCKILAAKILNIIIDYEYNVRVSIITKYFKDVMEMDVDLSKYEYNKKDFIELWNKHIEYDKFYPQNDKEGYILMDKIWIDKVNQILKERNIFSECQKEGVDETLVLFQAFVYSNQELTNLTLQLIRRITNQRQEILKTFKDIIFVAGGHLKNLATRGVQTTRSVLLNLTSPKVKSMRMDSADNCLWMIIRKQQMKLDSIKLGAVQQLASLTMSMMKSKANPTSFDASNFYQPTDLYPYSDLSSNVKTGSDGSYLIITEKDQNLPLNQNLIKSQDHHLLIIDFIKIMQDLPQNTLPITALHAAYNFLTVLIWNHNDNKKQLEGILKLSECHLGINVGCIDFYKQMYTNNKKLVKKTDIKPIITQVIDLANSQLISNYLKSKLLDFLRIIVIFDDQGYDINQNMVMEIISQKQVSNNNQIVYLSAEEANRSSLSNTIANEYSSWIDKYADAYEYSTTTYEPLNVSPQLFYVATFFEVFSALIQNQNVVNIGKASNMHPIDFLLNIMKASKNCWIVIRHLRAYLNRLYYFEKRSKDTSLYQKFTNEDLEIIRAQLRSIAQLVCNTPNFNEIRIKNPIRYSYVGSYVYLSLEEILHSLDLIFRNKDYQTYFTLEFTSQKAPEWVLNFRLLEIIEMLEYLLKTIDGRSINKYMSKVSKRLKGFASGTPLEAVNSYTQMEKQKTNQNIARYKISGDDIPFRKSYLFHDGKGFWRHLLDWNSFKDQQIQRQKDINKVQKRQDPNPNESKEAENQRKRDFLLDVLYLGNIDKKIQKKIVKKEKAVIEQTKQNQNQDKAKGQLNLPKNLTTSQSVRFRVKNERFSSSEIKNNIINQRRRKLVKFIEVNDKFREFSQAEIAQTLYNRFALLNDISKKRYNEIIVGNQQVIQSIVRMNEADPMSIRPEYKLLIIRLLTNFIHRQCEIFSKDIKQWYVNKEDSVLIQNPQNFLYECGVATFLSSLIINDLRYSIEMSNAILMLGISLLLGKNSNNQNQIFKLIRDDQKNTFLSQLNILVKDCGAFIDSHKIGGQVRQFNSNAINFSDTYDFYIDTQKIMKRKFAYIPETVEEQKEFDEKVVNMQYAFIFLKNLCEGNNDIKNYIREQMSVEEEKKIKAESVNFITLGVTQLKKMFSNFNISIIKVPYAIIDFIYEVTQIPCLDNQLFLSRTSLFHDFATLQIQITDMIAQKKIDPNPNNIITLFELYAFNIKNVISCLEGNIDQIYQNLSTDALCRYFVEVLAFYIKYLPVLTGRTTDIKTAEELAALLDQNKLHQNEYLNMFQATSVIVKLDKKSKVKQFKDRINIYLKRFNMNEFFELLKRNLLGIEIKMDEYELASDFNQTLFFPRHKVFNYLSRSTRNIIMEEVDRSTQRDKIIGLLNTKQEINQQIQYNYILDNKYQSFGFRISITNAKIEYYMNLGLNIAAFICLLMAYFAAVVYYPYEDVIQYDLGTQSKILKALSIVQFIVTLIYLYLWTKTHLHLAIKKYERIKRAEQSQGENVSESKLLLFLFKIPGIKNFYCLTYDSQLGNVLLYIFGSGMGMFYRIEWFSILLMNLLMAHLDVLKNILQALKQSMGMLGMLSFFGASFIAFFSVFSIYFYTESIYPQNHPKEHCQSVLKCIIQLYIKEEIGNDMQVFKIGRFIYDMIYVVFMDMLFGNIVGGVLIDNFASLRGAREEMLKDKTEKCFICGIDKQTLEKKNLDLKTHYTQQYHKLWNYVFYLYYLEQQTKKTGLQEIIERKYMSEDVSWIPIATSEQSDIGELINELQKLIKEQQTTIKSIEKKQ